MNPQPPDPRTPLAMLAPTDSDPSANPRTYGNYGAPLLPAAPAPLPFVESPVPSVIYGAARPTNGPFAAPIFPVSTAPASV